MNAFTQHDSTATEHTLLVFVHGNGLCKSTFNATIQRVLALNATNTKNGLHCIAFDLPGHGEHPSAGQLLEEYTLISHFSKPITEAVNAYVANVKVKFTQKVLVAHSIGCQMSLFAHKTLKFDHALLIEPIGVPKIEGMRVDPPKHFVDKSNARRRNFSSFQAAYEALRPKGMYALWEDECVKDYVFRGGLRKCGGEEAVELCCLPLLEGKIFSLDITEIDPELEQLKFKSVTVMVGADSVHLPRMFFEMTAEKLGAKFLVIDNAAHVIMCEKPQLVAQEIFNILESSQHVSKL